MVRRWWVVAGVSLGALGIALVVALLVQAQVGVGNPGSSNQGPAQRVQAQVAELSAESMAESIANLVQPDMYFWPGASPSRSRRLAFPLLPEEGQEAIATILSNRRFLRVYEELAALPPQEAAAVLNEALPPCLQSHQVALDGYLAGVRRAKLPPEGELVGGPSFQIGGPSDGRPNPLGERYRLLALVLVAGNLGLEGAHEAVWQVVAEGLAHRQLFYRDDEFHEGFRLAMLTAASLYNRQILG